VKPCYHSFFFPFNKHYYFGEYQLCWSQIAPIRSSTVAFLEGSEPLFFILLLTLVTKDGIWSKTESHTQAGKYVLP